MKPSAQNKKDKQFGLYQSDIACIVHILQQHPEVAKGYVIGSRAMGSYRHGSDVDLVLQGETLTFAIASRISYLLNEETKMPYQFDVINYNTVRNTELIDHIESAGELFYTKDRAATP